LNVILYRIDLGCITYEFHDTTNHWSGFPDTILEIQEFLLPIGQYPHDAETELLKRSKCGRSQIYYLASAYAFPLRNEPGQYSDMPHADTTYPSAEYPVVPSTPDFLPSI